MLCQISCAEYLPRGISDHAPFLVVMTHVGRPSKLCRLNPCWLEVVPVESKCTLDIEEYWRNNSGTSNPLTEWEVLKALMWGALIHAFASYKAELGEFGLALEREITTRFHNC